MDIRLRGSGNFEHFRAFADRVRKRDIWADLPTFGQMGVDALANATPRRTGLTAASWYYKIIPGSKPGIAWYNSNEDDQGTPIVILIDYGHGTGTGGYVQGLNFVDPALQSIFQQIADDIWEKVTQQ